MTGSLWRRVRRTVRTVHQYLRELTGETAYEHYLDRSRSSGGRPLDRRAFEARRRQARQAGAAGRCC